LRYCVTQRSLENEWSIGARVVDPSWFVSDPTLDPNPVSDPATLVSASRELRGKLALYSWNYDDI
jgi:hypothetical protein